MLTIRMNKFLRKHEAIIVDGDQKSPDGYLDLVGFKWPGGSLSIAFPEKYLVDPKLLRKLIAQGEKCIMRSLALGSE